MKEPPNGKITSLDKDTFLKRKAEIGNQAFCATLLKTGRKPAPVRFPEDLLIVGDMSYWAKYGMHCKKIIMINLPLAQYRWHNTNETILRSTNIQGLIIEERSVTREIEEMRDQPWSGFLRRAKLECLFAARSGVKAKRFRQLGNMTYAREIDQIVRSHTGLTIWLAARALVELREITVFKIGGRPRKPNNVYS